MMKAYALAGIGIVLGSIGMFRAHNEVALTGVLFLFAAVVLSNLPPRH